MKNSPKNKLDKIIPHFKTKLPRYGKLLPLQRSHILSKVKKNTHSECHFFYRIILHIPINARRKHYSSYKVWNFPFLINLKSVSVNNTSLVLRLACHSILWIYNHFIILAIHSSKFPVLKTTYLLNKELNVSNNANSFLTKALRQSTESSKWN